MNEPSKKLNPQEFDSARNEMFVYGWWRRDSYLYVGHTTQGFSCFRRDKIIGRKAEVAPSDEFHFWYCKELTELVRLEKELVALHHPIFHTPLPDFDARLIPCGFCRNMFFPSREWQKFCTDKCRKDAKEHQRNALKNGIVEKECVHCHEKYEAPQLQAPFCPECNKLRAPEDRY